MNNSKILRLPRTGICVFHFSPGMVVTLLIEILRKPLTSTKLIIQGKLILGTPIIMIS